MDKKSAPSTPAGVTVREMATGARIQIAFSWHGQQCRELLPPGPVNKGSIQYAANLRAEIRRKITDGTFVYAEYFPGSAKARAPDPLSCLMEEMLVKQ
ncbi:Arm DNA-binding domain-containing protein, partial [Delftia acidovorans]